jgi:hypothetical protein
MATPVSLTSSPLPSTSRSPSTPSPAAGSSTSTSPLLRLSTTFQPESAVKERDTAGDDDTTLLDHTLAQHIRTSRASSYNPKQWRTSSSFPHEPLDKISNRSSLEDHLYQRGYLTGVCSDITITAFNKSYSLHRIILDRSAFFSSLFAGPWKDADTPVLNLDFSDPNITQEAFEIAIQRLYGHKVQPEEDAIAGLYAAGAYLDLQDLVEESLHTLITTLNSQNVAKRYQFARGKQYYGEGSEKLAEACYTLLCHAGSSMSLDLWDGVPNDVAAEVLSADAFWVEGEYERYCFVRDFIQRRKTQAEDVQALEQVLHNGIYYLHLPFETLHMILEEKDQEGKPFVSPAVIHNALWQQTNLKQIILSTDGTSPSLNLAVDEGWSVPSKDTMTDTINGEEETEVTLPEKMASDLTSPVAENDELGCTSSPFPPFRFSVEFRGIRALTEGEKFFSRTVFYAGSHWRVTRTANGGD